jgi:cytoplasmic iron level regulating protein YaaA (DUF328/UPF0246 family)
VIILIHTSKTMRPPVESGGLLDTPVLLEQAHELSNRLKQMPALEIEKMMKISPKLASVTKGLITDWTDNSNSQRAAIDSFLGDIYSGLQAQSWSVRDREYANEHLRILSGLYGILKPLDGIYPYRFEMGYRLPNQMFKNMYEFWSDRIVRALPSDELIINLSAVEYGKTITKYIDGTRIITPKFLTVSSTTGEPTFVTVHAKIARGAFASWVIRHRVERASKLQDFNEIGYVYDRVLSVDGAPVFVCKQFEGLGLSIRLT